MIECYTQSHAPAKLILSGEHAVLFGAPAIGMALKSFGTQTTISKAPAPTQDPLLLILPNLQTEMILCSEALHRLKRKIDHRYISFLKDNISAAEIIHPQELIPYLLALYADIYSVRYEGYIIEVSSTIPIGLGLGSSASSIISLLKALSMAFVPITPHAQMIQMASQVENLVHGKSSGFDVKLVYGEECVYQHQQHYLPCPTPKFPFQLIHTGIPITNTAECVQTTQLHLTQYPKRITQFTDATLGVIGAIKRQHLSDFQINIAKNHRLLCDIGVVPDKVKAFIAEIEKRGSVAKICGAGASKGDSAGVLYVCGSAPIFDILTEYQYQQLLS